MGKFLNMTEISAFEVENLKLDKLVRKVCSDNQEPVIVLKREVFTDSYTLKSSLVYRLYFRSHLDSRPVHIKFFHSLDAFCLWYVSKHPYKDFYLVNYTQL